MEIRKAARIPFPLVSLDSAEIFRDELLKMLKTYGD